MELPQQVRSQMEEFGNEGKRQVSLGGSENSEGIA